MSERKVLLRLCVPLKMYVILSSSKMTANHMTPITITIIYTKAENTKSNLFAVIVSLFFCKFSTLHIEQMISNF